MKRSAGVLVVGAGIHGLSTAWHLARDGEDVLVVDKAHVGAGASGIACGIVRNNYFQPAMSALMAACVDIWEEQAEALAYHGVGYVALGPPAQESDLAEVHERHERLGYPSELIVGERAVAAHMGGLFGDWRAPGLTVCLHEHRGGFAYNLDAVRGLERLAREAGARIAEGVTVTGFDLDGAGAVTTVHTNGGAIAAEQVVVAAGPWTARLWKLLELPEHAWRHWYLQEGEIAVDPASFATAAGAMPPVLHVDSDAPLRDDDGALVTDEPWGIYFKRDRAGVQGGAAPLPMDDDGALELDPYPTGTVDPGFARMWTAALSHCLARFDGSRKAYRDVRSGGAGAFTLDSFPIFDAMRPNVFVIADSNHGYKMIVVGREVARVLRGERSELLEPFAFERFAAGRLHPVSHSPYPWS